MMNAGRKTVALLVWIGRHSFLNFLLLLTITMRLVFYLLLKFLPCILFYFFFFQKDSPHDPDGVCLVWNTRYKKSTPEYIFHCQSPVLSCCFARFHPNLILGGTYSGKIVLWDNRSPKRTPVQRSPLSASAHTVK